MQTSLPSANPLGLLLLIAIIYLAFKSPQKLQSVIRMGTACEVTLLLFIIPAADSWPGRIQSAGR
jgi:hypothetical protein